MNRYYYREFTYGTTHDSPNQRTLALALETCQPTIEQTCRLVQFKIETTRNRNIFHCCAVWEYAESASDWDTKTMPMP